MSKYYKISRDQAQSKPKIERTDQQIECSVENGCLPISSKQNNELICTAKCSQDPNCLGCYYHPEKKECVCYQDKSEEILDREFQVLSNDIARGNRSSSGFGKRRNLPVTNNQSDTETCSCGK